MADLVFVGRTDPRTALDPMPSRHHDHLVAALGLLLALTLAACGGSDADETSTEGRTATSVRIGVDSSASTSNGSPSTDPSSTTADSSDAGGDGGEADDGDGTNDATSTDSADDTSTTEAPAEDSNAWPSTDYRLVEVASVAFPTTLVPRPGSDDLWVAEREGRVLHLRRDGNGFDLDPTPTLDITELVTTDGEGGLLGMTFSADGQSLYVSYTNNDGNSVVADYPMDGDQADRALARILISVEQPFSNHNGGQIERGPDGLLYFGLGDGGSGGDPLDSGQDTTTLLGSILRIDPSNPGGEAAYGIPASNPFASGDQGRPEIWLYGVRNPWRFSFDMATDDLWIGDVGQNAVEEITYLQATNGLAGRGANLGWRLREGDQPFDGGSPPPGHVAPIYTYGRDAGCSVTGGYVYRGQSIPDLDGVYLFGDYCAGEIIGLQILDDGSLLAGDVVTDRGVGQIVSFAQDGDGEVYLLGAGGSISRLEAG